MKLTITIEIEGADGFAVLDELAKSCEAIPRTLTGVFDALDAAQESVAFQANANTGHGSIAGLLQR